MAKVPSLDDLQKMYSELGGSGEVIPKEARSQKGKSKKVKVEGPPNLPAEIEEEVYSEVHFFLRPNQIWQHVLQDAKVEANVRGSNVLVFAHSHKRGEACEHLCRQVKGE